MNPQRLLASVVLPPLGVFMGEGRNRRFWLNAGLTALGYIPGVIHAVWLTTRR